MTDQELLRAYVDSSDRESLGVFLTRYQGSLMRFTGRLLGDRDAAQDVVQETFLEVARRPRRLLGVDNCHNWLLRVARNLGVTRLRREVRARRHVEVLRDRGAGVAAETGGSAALEADELKARVRAEIDRLNPRHSEILLLKIQEDKSYKEIAQITGLTVTNVGYLLHHAMKELTARLNHAREGL